MGQPKCYCPSGTIAGNVLKPIRLFEFGNDRFIGLCGYQESDSIFSEFVLLDCSSKKTVGEWSATEMCSVKKFHDTLVVHELYSWPIDKAFGYRSVPFYTTLFYYQNDSINKHSYFRTDYRKYSQEEILEIISSYKNHKPANNSDSTIQLADKLFWAYISGSKEAEQHLKNVEKTWGPFDGAIAEEWNHIINTYVHFKELEKKGLVKNN